MYIYTLKILLCCSTNQKPIHFQIMIRIILYTFCMRMSHSYIYSLFLLLNDINQGIGWFSRTLTTPLRYLHDLLGDIPLVQSYTWDETRAIIGHKSQRDKIQLLLFGGFGSFVVHSNLDIANKFIRPHLFTILNNSLYQI